MLWTGRRVIFCSIPREFVIEIKFMWYCEILLWNLEASRQKKWHFRRDTVIKLRTERNVPWEEDGRSCEPWSRNETDPTPDTQVKQCYRVETVTRIKRHKNYLHALVGAVEKSKRKVEEFKNCQWWRNRRQQRVGWQGRKELTAVDKDMDSMAKYFSEMDQEQLEKSRRAVGLREGIIWTKVEIQPGVGR